MIEQEATSIVKPGTAEDERKIQMLARPEKEIEQPDFPGVLEPKRTKTPRRRRYSRVLVLLLASVVGAGRASRRVSSFIRVTFWRKSIHDLSRRRFILPKGSSPTTPDSLTKPSRISPGS